MRHHGTPCIPPCTPHRAQIGRDIHGSRRSGTMRLSVVFTGALRVPRGPYGGATHANMFPCACISSQAALYVRCGPQGRVHRTPRVMKTRSRPPHRCSWGTKPTTETAQRPPRAANPPQTVGMEGVLGLAVGLGVGVSMCVCMVCDSASEHHRIVRAFHGCVYRCTHHTTRHCPPCLLHTAPYTPYRTPQHTALYHDTLHPW